MSLNYSRPRKRLVSDISAADGKIAYIFYSVRRITKGLVNITAEEWKSMHILHNKYLEGSMMEKTMGRVLDRKLLDVLYSLHFPSYVQLIQSNCHEELW